MGDRYSDNSLDKTAIDDRFVTTSVSSGSEVCTFTDYGLKRALERSVLRPTMPITHRDQKDAEYIEYIAQQRQLLRDQLRGAEQRYNEIDEERDANEDSIQAIWLHAAWLRASNDLQRAERSYNIFMDEIKVLLEMPPIPRADMYSEVTVKRNQAHRDLKEAEAIEDALLEPSNRSKFEMATLKKEVRDLKVQLTEASKSFTWAQEEINRMRDYNVAAIQKHVKTTQELQMQLGSSRLREEYLEEEIQGYDNELARQDELLRQFKSGAQPYPADAMIVRDPSEARVEQAGHASDETRREAAGADDSNASDFRVSEAAALGDIGEAGSLRRSHNAHSVCNWHAPETCRITPPEEQARGKFCAVIERN